MIPLAIARTEMVRLLRDRTALFFVLVLPVVIIVVIGSTFGSGPTAIPVGVLDADGSSTSSTLVAALGQEPALSVTRYDDAAALEQDLRARAIVGGIVVPAGLEEALAAGQGTVTLYASQTDQTTPAIIQSVSSAVGAEGQVLAAVRFALANVPDADAGSVVSSARSLADGIPRVGVAVETVGDVPTEEQNQFSYTAPSNLVLFVFINSLAVGGALAESRRLGVVRRMYAAPVPARAILVGLGASRFLFALIQSALILAVGAWGFGVRWGDPVAVLALVVSYSLVATGAGLLVGAVADDPDRAQAVGIPVAIGLAMLGGCMWPLEIVPAPMRALGHLTPHAWAMDGWVQVIFEGGGLGAVAGSVAVLLGYAVVLVGVATWRLRVVLTR